MSITLRIILIVCSIFSFVFCITKIKQAKLKITNSVVWMLGSFIIILMSTFSELIEWISLKLGFIAPVNFVFFIMIAFVLIQIFVDNIRISALNEKIKDLNHYIALKELAQKESEGKNE